MLYSLVFKINNYDSNKKYQLKSALLELSDKNINNFFDDNKKQILTALEILGEATFVHAYNLKMTGLKDLCEKCEIIKENSNADYYEKLLLQTNPSASKKYLNLQQNILELKRNYVEVKNSGNTSDLKRLQDEINTLTTESMNVLAQKIPYDPDTTIRKIKLTAEIACEFDENPTKSNHYKLIDLMKNPSVENEKKEREIVCKTIFDKLEMEYDEKLAEKIDLVNWRYLREIISANSTFLDNLKKIFEEIQNNPDKQISEIFNELEHNKETKRYFDKLHINYDKWVNFDENSYVIIGNKYSSINVGNKSLEVLENILNSDNFINLSQSYKTDILKQLEDYTITAPITGTVVTKNTKQGDNLDNTNGQNTLAEIYDLSYLKFDISVDELDINKMKVGQKVKITCDSLEGTFEGVVTNVSVAGTTLSGYTTYPVTVEIKEVPEGLLPGMNITAEIVVEQAQDVLAVPVSAVQRGNIVYVKDASVTTAPNKNIPVGYKEVKVETGFSNSTYIEIVSGLSEGDVIFVPYTVSSGSAIFNAMMNMSEQMNMEGMSPHGNMGAGMPNRGGGF